MVLAVNWGPDETHQHDLQAHHHVKQRASAPLSSCRWRYLLCRARHRHTGTRQSRSRRPCTPSAWHMLCPFAYRGAFRISRMAIGLGPGIDLAMCHRPGTPAGVPPERLRESSNGDHSPARNRCLSSSLASAKAMRISSTMLNKTGVAAGFGEFAAGEFGAALRVLPAQVRPRWRPRRCSSVAGAASPKKFTATKRCARGGAGDGFEGPGDHDAPAVALRSGRAPCVHKSSSLARMRDVITTVLFTPSNSRTAFANSDPRTRGSRPAARLVEQQGTCGSARQRARRGRGPALPGACRQAVDRLSFVVSQVDQLQQVVRQGGAFAGRGMW